MLAYVFWHWPDPSVDRARYADALVAFHRALAWRLPPGVRGSRVFEVEGAPWVPAGHALEDWYFVEDFTALGVLNDAAVSGARGGPHDDVARLAAGGAGGVYRLRAPSRGGPTLDRTTWCSKPPGVPYADFLARLPPAEVWQRQLVLGPAPEFCLVGVDALAALGGVAVAARRIHASP